MTRYSILSAGPLGDLLATADADALTGLFVDGRSPQPGWERDDGWFAPLARQLDEYVAGRRTAFDVPLRLLGSPFQRAVWTELRRVPYGTTISYGELAARLGRPGAARAVGLANGRNPVSIVVPCHRVIGSSGALTGYGGGLERKRTLLELEAGTLSLAQPECAPCGS